MNKNYEILVNEEFEGKRLDSVICSSISGLTRSSVKNHAVKITVNDKEQKFSYKCKNNDKVEIELVWEEQAVNAENIDLEILYEDDNYIIINKPYGMVVHPAAGNYSGTLVNGLLGLKKELSVTNEEFRPGIVHRLDKETSGIIVTAKNITSHEYLSKLFRKRAVYKEYAAIVKGFYTPAEHTIISNIGRDPHNRKKMAVVNNKGKESITEVTVTKRNNDASLLKIVLKTGRTHQIRVHLSDRNHPVIGDPIYSRSSSKYAGYKLCLVAKRISFYDKFSEKQIEISVDYPEHIKKCINDFKLYSNNAQKLF